MTPMLLRHTELFFTRPHQKPKRPTPTNAQLAARSAVAWFVVAVLGLNGAVLIGGDILWPRLRDPEYGQRAYALHARIAENPGRPLVLVVGSSRVGGGIHPAAWEAVRLDNPHQSDPLLFNMGRAGAGPVNQLMMLRRTLAEGIRPKVVLFEYWWPLMTEICGPESARIGPDQVFAADLPVVRAYYPDGKNFERQVLKKRLNPIFELRRTLLLQVAPDWLPWPGRVENLWAPLDSWGWLPGMEIKTEDLSRRQCWVSARKNEFAPKLRNFVLNANEVRAMDEAVALARQYGAAVGFVQLPESSEFQSWYSPETAQASQAYLQAIGKELSVPVIDCRTWLEDLQFVDGFHLSRDGAAEFTGKLAPVTIAAFPNMGAQP